MRCHFRWQWRCGTTAAAAVLLMQMLAQQQSLVQLLVRTLVRTLRPPPPSPPPPHVVAVLATATWSALPEQALERELALVMVQVLACVALQLALRRAPVQLMPPRLLQL